MIAQPPQILIGARTIENGNAPVSGQQLGTQERRQHERVTKPWIAVDLGDKTYVSHSWSLGGFIIDGYEGKLTPGALHTIKAIGRVGADPIAVTVRSRVIRFESSKRRLVVNFLGLDNRAYGILQEVMAERMQLLKTRRSA
jgi:hypothetical protein